MEARTELRKERLDPRSGIDEVMNYWIGSKDDDNYQDKDPALLHREECWEFILRDAAPWHKEYLTKFGRLWDYWNEEFFDGEFQARPHILLDTACIPQALGDYSRTGGWGGKAQIRIRESLLRGTHPHVRRGEAYAEGRFLFVVDVLLHECIHQYQHEILRIKKSSSYVSHGPTFRDKANDIGEKLGLPPVRASKKRGKDKDLPSCSFWPHIVRPKDYYQGAYVPWGGNPETGTSRTLEQEIQRILRKWTKEEILNCLEEV